MTKWLKYTHVCSTCDTLIEYTSQLGMTNVTCPCGGNCTYLSVQDATIPSTTTTKEETMETTQALALQEMIQKKDEYIARLQNQISMDSTRIGLYTNSVNSLKEYLVENYNELEMHADSIADIFDISLKREVTVNFVIHASATIEVEPGFDVEDLITDNVFVDANHGDIVIDDYSVEDVQEV